MSEYDDILDEYDAVLGEDAPAAPAAPKGEVGALDFRVKPGMTGEEILRGYGVDEKTIGEIPVAGRASIADVLFGKQLDATTWSGAAGQVGQDIGEGLLRTGMGTGRVLAQGANKLTGSPSAAELKVLEIQEKARMSHFHYNIQGRSTPEAPMFDISTLGEFITPGAGQAAGLIKGASGLAKAGGYAAQIGAGAVDAMIGAGPDIDEGTAAGMGAGVAAGLPVLGKVAGAIATPFVKAYNVARAKFNPTTPNLRTDNYVPEVDQTLKAEGIPASISNVNPTRGARSAEQFAEEAPFSGANTAMDATQAAAAAAAKRKSDMLAGDITATDFADTTRLTQASQDTLNGKPTRRAVEAQKLLAELQQADSPAEIAAASAQLNRFNTALEGDDLYTTAYNLAPGAPIKLDGYINAIKDSQKKVTSSDEPNEALTYRLERRLAAATRAGNRSDFQAVSRELRSNLKTFVREVRNGEWAGRGIPKSAAENFELDNIVNKLDDDIEGSLTVAGKKDAWDALRAADEFHATRTLAAKESSISQKLDSETKYTDESITSYIQRGEKVDRPEDLFNSLDNKGRAAVRATLFDTALAHATATGKFEPTKLAKWIKDRESTFDIFMHRVDPATGARIADDKFAVKGYVNAMQYLDNIANSADRNTAQGIRRLAQGLGGIMTIGGGATGGATGHGVGTGAAAGAGVFIALGKAVNAMTRTPAGIRFLTSASDIAPNSPAMKRLFEEQFAPLIRQQITRESTFKERSNGLTNQ